MRILVTRPEPGAARTAAWLGLHGHTAVVAPLMTIAASGEPMPAGPFGAIVVTSANAFAALKPTGALPVLAVGERTAAAARAAGFNDVHAATGDRHGLAALARDRLPPGQRLLVAVGRDRKGDTATLLAGAGHDPILWTVYVAKAATVLPAAARDALRDGRLDGVLHYSRRSAAIALALARGAGLESAFLSRCHICLSADVAGPLRQAGAERLVIAKKPDEACLMAALEAAQ